MLQIRANCKRVSILCMEVAHAKEFHSKHKRLTRRIKGSGEEWKHTSGVKGPGMMILINFTS